jgi:hypothetical protein
MKNIIFVLIVFSLLAFISLANAASISRSLSIGDVLDAQDFLFDSALGTLEDVIVETYSSGDFFYLSNDSPPYSSNVRELMFYYKNQFILEVENLNLGSRIHQESDFGYGNDLCLFYGNGQAKTGAGTWGIQGEFYNNASILSFFTLQENDTSVSLENVFNEINPTIIYDDLGKEYELSHFFFDGGMTINYHYTPIPEPSTCVILFFGILGLGGIKKKFRT